MLFIDLDGVLADFDQGFYSLFGRLPDRDNPTIPPQKMWDALRNHENFYGSLSELKGASDFFESVMYLKPTILTGVPRGGWAEPQKKQWVKDRWPDVPVICTFAVNKYKHCKPGDVLVDDLPKARVNWEKAGGHFILHESPEKSRIDVMNYFTHGEKNG